MKSRIRWLYFFLVIITIPLGLGSRFYTPLPWLVLTYGGDVLAATCIFFGTRFLFPLNSIVKIGFISYFICVAIELQQLIQVPWLVNLRDKTIMGILLGHGFLWSDLVCYVAGTLFGVLIGYFLERRLTKSI